MGYVSGRAIMCGTIDAGYLKCGRSIAALAGNVEPHRYKKYIFNLNQYALNGSVSL